jgi:hypothetical protein
MMMARKRMVIRIMRGKMIKMMMCRSNRRSQRSKSSLKPMKIRKSSLILSIKSRKRAKRWAWTTIRPIFLKRQ